MECKVFTLDNKQAGKLDLADEVFGINIRRDILSDVKDLLKEKLITQDDEHRAQDEVQQLTDKHIAQMDGLLNDKEKELMEF